MTRTEYELIYDAFKSHRYKMTDAQEVLVEKILDDLFYPHFDALKIRLNNWHTPCCIFAAGGLYLNYWNPHKIMSNQANIDLLETIFEEVQEAFPYLDEEKQIEIANNRFWRSHNDFQRQKVGPL